MPQGPVALRDIRNATDYVCNITAATAVRTAAGRVVRVNVITAGDTTGKVYDIASAAATAAGKVVFAIPATVGVYSLDWPVKSGVTIIPASNQVLAVSLA